MGVAAPYRRGMKSEPQAFAERLRAALATARISDKPVDLMKLVARYGGDSVSQQAVSNWLNGRNMPGRRNLRALARLLNVDVLELESGTGPSRRVREKRQDWPAAAVQDQHAIASFLALPDARRKLIRELIEALSSS